MPMRTGRRPPARQRLLARPLERDDARLAGAERAEPDAHGGAAQQERQERERGERPREEGRQARYDRGGRPTARGARPGSRRRGGARRQGRRGAGAAGRKRVKGAARLPTSGTESRRRPRRQARHVTKTCRRAVAVLPRHLLNVARWTAKRRGRGSSSRRRSRAHAPLLDGVTSRLAWTTPPYLLLDHASETFRDLLNLDRTTILVAVAIISAGVNGSDLVALRGRFRRGRAGRPEARDGALGPRGCSLAG